VADINQTITLGIGTPSGILEFLTFGLQIGDVFAQLVREAILPIRVTASADLATRATATAGLPIRKTATMELEL